jgi:hypothetical protein
MKQVQIKKRLGVKLSGGGGINSSKISLEA